VSNYLEEAADLFRAAAADVAAVQSGTYVDPTVIENRIRLGQEFADLAAIDKGIALAPRQDGDAVPGCMDQLETERSTA
jgi:hypothetical protein